MSIFTYPGLIILDAIYADKLMELITPPLLASGFDPQVIMPVMCVLVVLILWLLGYLIGLISIFLGYSLFVLLVCYTYLMSDEGMAASVGSIVILTTKFTRDFIFPRSRNPTSSLPFTYFRNDFQSLPMSYMTHRGLTSLVSLSLAGLVIVGIGHLSSKDWLPPATVASVSIVLVIIVIVAAMNSLPDAGGNNATAWFMVVSIFLLAFLTWEPPRNLLEALIARLNRQITMVDFSARRSIGITS